MKDTLSFLLLVLSFSSVKCESMESLQTAVQNKPGETLSLSCRGSGFTFSSYGMNWIRQQAGKPLEWMGYIYTDGSNHDYAASFQGRIEITRDNSNSMVYLKLSGVTAEDSAVFYCARAAFDYWGKGTMVTVTSGGQSPPTSLVSVSACSASSDGFLTIGCITSGFSPAESLKFSWTGGATDEVQYPAVQQAGKYTSVSHARVKASEWDAMQAFTCKAENPAGHLQETITKPEKKPVPVQAATLLLTAPTTQELEAGRASFICIASQFSPRDYTFTWMLDDKEISGRNRATILTEEESTITLYTAISILDLSASEWMDKVSTVKCVFKDSNGNQTQEAKYSQTADDVTEKVTITPPSTEDMLVRGAGDLQCTATGRKGFTSMRWMRNDQNITSTTEKDEQGTFITARAKIDYSDWNKGTVYTCVVEHSLFVELVKTYDYRRENGGDKRCPSVYLLAPPENSQDDWVTLTCYVKHFYPKEVVVHWLANDEKLNNTEEYQQRTTSLIEIEKDLYSVYSQLVVRAGQWESGTMFSCLVYHEAIDPTVRLIARSIDNSSNKPTLVSLSMNVPSISTCAA